MRVLRKLHYNGQNDDWINQEFHEIKTTIAAEKSITAPGWRIMFTVKQWRTRLMHATLMQVFTQMTGINVINYYQTIMYENLGIEGSRNLLVTGIYNCVGPLCSESNGAERCRVSSTDSSQTSSSSHFSWTAWEGRRYVSCTI
ncbi:General substrate transporter [Macrophomina phaseolina MS6]|uniref:General substrate transporter n=1 Tax=Macrophomina phaseolina (strain MS6) TaxID=1126212 RepID=K2S8M3_MACPH|nr:General substrate transporter [Macrophomina phaseolina MS6]